MEKTGPKNKAQTPAPEKPTRLIYCGPNISGGALSQYTVYKGDLPAHLSALFEKCPAVKTLCVPVSNLATTQKAVAVTGSAEHIAYNRILEYLRKGGKQ
jgi:hypothetical protein